MIGTGAFIGMGIMLGGGILLPLAVCIWWLVSRKEKIIAALDNAIWHGDMDRMAALRRSKKTL